MSLPLQLLLLLAIVVAAAKLTGALATRVGQPSVFGGERDASSLFAIVKDFADVGVVLLMFVAGLETDLAGVRRVGRVAFWAATGGVDVTGLLVVALRISASFAVAIASGRLLPPLLRRASTLPVSEAVLAAAGLLAFVYSWAAEALGTVAPITGAYIAGVLIARTPYKAAVDRGIHPLTYSLLVPVFFISIGLEANGRNLGNRAAFTVALLAVAVATKVLGSGAPARVCGFTGKESLRVGIGTISRGEVGLITRVTACRTVSSGARCFRRRSRWCS